MIYQTKAIHDNKETLAKMPLQNVPAPDFVFIPLANSRCGKGALSIQEGDPVYLGERIGLRQGPFFEQPIFSTVSGVFVGLEKHYYRTGVRLDFAKIKNDFKDTIDPSLHERTDEEIAKLSKDEIRDIVKDKPLVGLGGSSFPTYVKFQTKTPIKTLLINGVECEPMMTSDQRFMLDHSEEILAGIRLLLQAFNCQDARICIKEKHQDVIEFYTQLLAKKSDKRITLSPMKDFYPQGWEIDMIKTATGVVVENGHLPNEYGIVNFNVATAAGVYLAVKKNLPVYERYFSLYGDGLRKSANLVVRVGSLLGPIVEKYGGYRDSSTSKTLIVGGPMMGTAVPSDDCVITPTMSMALIQEKHAYLEEPCIRCASCVLSCPVLLEPVQIMKAMRRKKVNVALLKKLNPMKCMECGLCTYSCPSKIPLLDYVRQAKAVVKNSK
jgi:Na+-translocating ferredoxin:NAD+ oxidoreductase subunit C